MGTFSHLTVMFGIVLSEGNAHIVGERVNFGVQPYAPNAGGKLLLLPMELSHMPRGWVFLYITKLTQSGCRARTTAECQNLNVQSVRNDRKNFFIWIHR